MHGVADLGERDTFPFEERSFLRQYVLALLAGDWGNASGIADRRRIQSPHLAWITRLLRLFWGLVVTPDDFYSLQMSTP